MFIFEGTGYCLPHTFVAGGLRVPLLLQKQESTRDSSQGLDAEVRLKLEAIFGEKVQEVLDFLGIRHEQHSSVELDGPYKMETVEFRKVFRYTISVRVGGKDTTLNFFTKQWSRDDKGEKEARLVEMLSSYGVTPKAKFIYVRNKPMLIQYAAEGKSLFHIDSRTINSSNNHSIISAIAYTLGKLHGLGVSHGDLVWLLDDTLSLGHIFLTRDTQGGYSAQFIDFSKAIIRNKANDKGILMEKTFVQKRLLKIFFEGKGRYRIFKKIKANKIFMLSYEKGKLSIERQTVVRDRMSTPYRGTDI